MWSHWLWNRDMVDCTEWYDAWDLGAWVWKDWIW